MIIGCPSRRSPATSSISGSDRRRSRAARRVVSQGRRVRRDDPRALRRRDRRGARRRLRRMVRDAARLARALILLDQFTRNIFRGTPTRVRRRRARARHRRWTRSRGASTARSTPIERWFLYLPFEHAEDLAHAGALARAVRRAGRRDRRPRRARLGREARRRSSAGSAAIRIATRSSAARRRRRRSRSCESPARGSDARRRWPRSSCRSRCSSRVAVIGALVAAGSRVPLPLVLVAGGVALSFVPGFERVRPRPRRLLPAVHPAALCSPTAG